jgi:tetratricopeptide (TPR) repeat protein
MFNEAIECANKLLELKSNFADGYEILAICYNALGDYENAEKYFTKSIKNGISEQKIRRAMEVYKDTGIPHANQDTNDTEEGE